MKSSRGFFLLFRYGILVLTGIAIVFLWKTCQLDHYESWGRFYALWIPILYGVFSTGYVIIEACCLSEREQPRYRDFRTYDDYTYLLPLFFFALELSAPYGREFYFWLPVFYLTLVVIKGGLLLVCLYTLIRSASPHQTQLETSPYTVSRHIQIFLVLTTLIIYSLISAYHIRRTSLTGDEPHYLLITHSLWHDHDTNLYNNYKNRDYTSFFWYELKPAYGDQVSATEIYSYRHKGGFPYILIPGYGLGGQLGTVLQTNLITSLLMLQVFLLSYELFHSLTASFYTWLCLAFSIPFVIYMGQIYPETLAALLTIWAVRHIRLLPLETQKRMTYLVRSLIGIAFAIILLVLLKARYVPIAGTLLLFLIFQIFGRYAHIKNPIRILAVIGVILLVVPMTLFLADTYLLGRMLRDRITDARYMEWMLSRYNPVFGLLGAVFDQEYGLFPYTPFYMFALVGIGILTRKELKESFPLLAIFSLNYAAICFWPLWHAAPTPPSRYLLPVLPLLGIFLARFFTQKRGLTNTIVLGIGSIWSFLTFWAVTLNPGWRYNWADGTNNLLEMLSFQLSMNLTKIFPSWIRLSPLTPYLTILGIVGIGVMIYLSRVKTRYSLNISPYLTPEAQCIVLVAVFVMLSTSALVIGRNLPTMVLEAEDSLDMRAQGGEQLPLASDPWHNQLYIREWKYYGWKLNPGNSLETRPKLYHVFPSARLGKQSVWELQIYARAQLDKRRPTDLPMMVVLMNEKEVGKVAVSSIDWKVYTFTLLVEEQRPRITISYKYKADSQSALIIDKIRFR